ncbi:hypothetical protein [Deinococcus hopiensis]|uniref:Uncharacterized protein n=1 Tax=Deinococcus hopiensis KR-140 TaxID=695939 RepID=A0A1W1V9H1_9DEIO|nr:hypothetical protein [Deinococcus hopiensis]SMB89978.1 hypothetical protein SAMN00790413_00609 [Deinococcus hopiensis KR-140]
MKSSVLACLALLSVSARAAPTPARVSPSLGVDWASVPGVKSLNFGSYKDTPYLRDAGYFKKAATELDRQWSAQGQKGRCNVKTAEIVSFSMTKAAELPLLENTVLAQIRTRMKVQPLGADSPPKFFQITGPGKTAFMSFSRVFLPDQPPVLTLRTCQMQ